MLDELHRSRLRAATADLGLVAVVVAADAYGAGLSRARLLLLAVVFVVLAVLAFTNHAQLARSAAACKRTRELVARYGTAEDVPSHEWWMLGILESEAGNIDDAHRAFVHLAASDDANASAWGWHRLGLMAQAVGNDDEARQAFIHTSRSSDAQLAAYGWLGQAQLAVAEGDLSGARTCAELAEDTGDAQVSVLALELLADIDRALHDPSRRPAEPALTVALAD